MPALTRWLPWAIVALGVVHLGYAVAESPGVVRAMLADGLVNASDDVHRDYVTWFVIGGLSLLMIGAIARWSVRTTGAVPSVLGWWMLGIGAFDAALEPDGGGWIMLLIGALVVSDERRSRARVTAGSVSLGGSE